MDTKKPFYGTPLSSSINTEHETKDGPINQRRTRLNLQQTVKDDQGRRRFHGAFTGGFSAGHYNSVDTIEGFRPRQFITHRKSTTSDDVSIKFSHKPEDYMDEEDLGEFGIAPKKIRISSNFGSDVRSRHQHDEIRNILSLRPEEVSVGERIVEYMESQNNIRPGRNRIETRLTSAIPTKNDYYGLGYKPLEARGSPGSSKFNPIKASLKEGRRIEISGEAFGSGVLEDDDDYVCADIHGYDDIRNYDFNMRSSSRKDGRANSTGMDFDKNDSHLLPGFKLIQDLETISLCDDMFSVPDIPTDWKMPARKEPYIPPVVKPSVSTAELVFKNKALRQFSFDTKFSSSSEVLRTDYATEKSGLLRYSDLKSMEPSRQKLSDECKSDQDDATVTLKREVVEWRPCSLLCKRFNVPNPFPDSKYCGTKPTDLSFRATFADTSNEISRDDIERDHLAPLDLRRSIFDVAFEKKASEEIGKGDNLDSEDEPQVIDISQAVSPYKEKLALSDDDSDIIIMEAPAREPELIELSSSSSVSSRLTDTPSEKRPESSVSIVYRSPPSKDRVGSGSRHKSPMRNRHKKHKIHKRNKRGHRSH